MSYPILYDSTSTVEAYVHNGFGFLSDCISCKVTEVANGEYQLDMQYPIDGIHFDKIEDRSVIKVKLNGVKDPQLFRVYSIVKKMDRIAKISARHISYDLSGIPVSSFTANSASAAVGYLGSYAVGYCPFSFHTDIDSEETIFVTPGSIRSKLGGNEESLLGKYGGEFEFNNFDITLHEHRGADNGFFVRYGKNLIDIKQERNCSSVYTGIYPYWMDSETKEVVELHESVSASGNYNFEKILVVDFSQTFEYAPDKLSLRTEALKYIQENEIGVPEVSLTCSFAQLGQYENYSGLVLSENVSLFDTVTVEFPELGISTKSKVVKVVYDVLLDRVDNVTIGSVKYNVTDTIIDNMK